MRVSDQSRFLGLVPNYNSLLSQQIDLQRQIASGKRWISADQDPVGVAVSQRLHTEDARISQYLRNADQATAFSQSSETAVGSAIDSMQRVHELAIQAGDATKSPADLQAIGVEVDSILQNMIDLGGTQYRGRNVFSGSVTTAPAFQSVKDVNGKITSVTFAGNSESLSTEYSTGQTIAYNVLGSNESGGDFGLMRDTVANVDVFQTLINFRDDIAANPANISADGQQITKALAHLTQGEARMGGVQAQLNAATQRHTDHQAMLTATLSKLEDTDVAAAATQLSQLQTAYQATLAVGARVGQMSLLNFLR